MYKYPYTYFRKVIDRQVSATNTDKNSRMGQIYFLVVKM